MYQIKKISINDPEYKKTLELRDKIMRKPLGLSIYDDDLSYEDDALIYIAEIAGEIIGLGIIHTVNENQAKVRFLCVDPSVRYLGVGKKILETIEEAAIGEYHSNEFILDARVNVQGFYEKCGYIPFGEEFQMEHAPIPHIYMTKKVK